MSDVSQGPGWWQASDGKWYPPEQAPGGPPPGSQGQGTGYGAPGYGQPGQGGPGWGSPEQGGGQGYGQPGQDAPGWGPPGQGGAQGYGQPGSGPPGYGTPGYGPPGGPGAPGYGPQYGSPYGAPGGYAYGPLAEWGQRVVAYLIDTAILVAGYIAVFILAAIFGAVADALGVLVGLVGYLAVVVASFYFLYLNGSVGQSPGKRLIGIKVIGERTGQPIGGGLGIVRGLAHFVDAIICYVGFLWPLWDDRKQTLADKIMSTVVIDGVPKEEFGPDIFRSR